MVCVLARLGRQVGRVSLDDLIGTWQHDPRHRPGARRPGRRRPRAVAVEIIIDTNRYRDFCDAEPYAVEVFRRVHAIHIPIMVVAELRAGFFMGSRSASNESVLARFLSRARVRVLRPDMATTHHYAGLFRQMRGCRYTDSDKRSVDRRTRGAARIVAVHS